MNIVCKLSSNCIVKIVHWCLLIHLRSSFEDRDSKIFLVVWQWIEHFPLLSVSLVFSDTWLEVLIQSYFCALRTSLSETVVIWG